MDDGGKKDVIEGRRADGRHAARYWRVRTALEVAKFIAWAVFFILWPPGGPGLDIAAWLM
ncbi:hypothetical protein [Spirillospora sp. NPDC048819]|uniref:hypothetical protein n=1 Tax=Spirillospora sp. NPDC048819 TaxID=3155268 RepID=UPI00340EE682